VASEQNLTGRMTHLRDDAFAHLGNASPTVTVDTVTDFTPAQDPLIAQQVKGTVAVPSYLDAPGGPPGSRLHHGRHGQPSQLPGNVQLAAYSCGIPRTASASSPARPALYLGDPSEINSGALKAYMSESNTMFCATPWAGMAREDIPTVLASLSDVTRFPSPSPRSAATSPARCSVCRRRTTRRCSIAAWTSTSSGWCSTRRIRTSWTSSWCSR
jgi:hypothetical protein